MSELDRRGGTAGELTKEEKQLAAFMAGSAVTYGIGAVAFPFFGDALRRSMNATLGGPPLEKSSERFWISLAGSLMSLLAVTSGKAASDVRSNGHLAESVCVSKAASTALFLLLRGKRGPRAYLFGAIVDGAICVLTAGMYARALRSRRNAAKAAAN